MIRNVELIDSEAICTIYNYYVENTTISFEEELVSVNEMRSKIKEIVPQLPFVVYENGSRVIGYAYATKWKARSAYRYSVETTVYVDVDSVGKGIGTALYNFILSELKEKGIHSAFGGIALPNEASISLHEKLGFCKVAHFKEVGYKFDTWIDVGYWQYRCSK